MPQLGFEPAALGLLKLSLLHLRAQLHRRADEFTAHEFQIFGEIDSLKFRSSMTLFAEATLKETAFQEALEKYFDGEADALTLEILE